MLLQPNAGYSSSPNSSDKDVRKFAYDSFKLVLSYSLDKSLSGDFEHEIADPSGLIVLLAEINAAEARNLLIQLVEVHLGPVHSEALDYAIVKQGKKIRASLMTLSAKPVQCAFLNNELSGAKLDKVKCLNKQDRDRIIASLLNLIDQGKPLEYEP